MTPGQSNQKKKLDKPCFSWSPVHLEPHIVQILFEFVRLFSDDFLELEILIAESQTVSFVACIDERPVFLDFLWSDFFSNTSGSLVIVQESNKGCKNDNELSRWAINTVKYWLCLVIIFSGSTLKIILSYAQKSALIKSPCLIHVTDDKGVQNNKLRPTRCSKRAVEMALKLCVGFKMVPLFIFIKKFFELLFERKGEQTFVCWFSKSLSRYRSKKRICGHVWSIVRETSAPL